MRQNSVYNFIYILMYECILIYVDTCILFFQMFSVLHTIHKFINKILPRIINRLAYKTVKQAINCFSVISFPFYVIFNLSINVALKL